MTKKRYPRNVKPRRYFVCTDQNGRPERIYAGNDIKTAYRRFRMLSAPGTHCLIVNKGRKPKILRTKEVEVPKHFDTPMLLARWYVRLWHRHGGQNQTIAQETALFDYVADTVGTSRRMVATALAAAQAIEKDHADKCRQRGVNPR